jgi:hypothetical protein
MMRIIRPSDYPMALHLYFLVLLSFTLTSRHVPMKASYGRILQTVSTGPPRLSQEKDAYVEAF